ncbi:hypothetical protein JCM8202_005613 [Rhodotorula sphaerocarpa]
MFSRALAPSARLCAQQTALPLRAARVSPFALSRGPTPARLAPAPFALAQKRTYANHQPAETSEHAGRPVTSTSHPTVPKTPPEPTPFFARKNIGLEVTPLMAFIGVIVTVGIGFMVHALLTEDAVQHRHGVPDDAELKKAIGEKPKEEPTKTRM